MGEGKGMLEHTEYLQTVSYYSLPPPVKSSSVWSDSQGLLKETQVGAKQEGKKWSEPMWMDLVSIRPSESVAQSVFLGMLPGVM